MRDSCGDRTFGRLGCRNSAEDACGTLVAHRCHVRPSETTLPGRGLHTPLTPTPTFSGAIEPPPEPAPRRDHATGGFSTAHPMPTMHELAGIVRDLSRETDLMAAVVRLQRSALRLLRVGDALCAWIDWPRRKIGRAHV